MYRSFWRWMVFSILADMVELWVGRGKWCGELVLMLRLR